MPESSDTDDLGVRVMRIVAQSQRIPVESVSSDSTFQELKIDSLDGINIVFALENEFGVNIPDESVHELRSVRQAIEGVRALVAQKQQTVPPGAA